MRGSSRLFFRNALKGNVTTQIKTQMLAVSLVGLGAGGLGGCSQGTRSAPKPIHKFPVAETPRAVEDVTIAREDWFNLDPEQDSIEGLGINRIYKELLEGRTQDLAPIVVAVIDSGVDITHEDLQGKIWTNEGEVGVDEAGKDKATNGIDDDGNGYVDDIHGWNYIGGYDSNGKPVSIGPETLEKTRILKKLQAKVDSGLTLVGDEEKLYEKVKKEVNEEKTAAEEELKVLEPALKDIEANYTAVATALNNKPLDLVTRADVAAVESQDVAVTTARDNILSALDLTGLTSVARVKKFIGLDHDSVDYNYNVNFDPRSTIVGDNPDDFSSTQYGNNDVSGIDNDHGTHVSGMIAANRDNNLGIKGIAVSAKIMGLRAVPNGDERDKDIARAIRYAADNGAQIINMSFGKQYSPHRAQVQEAIEYAEAKGLLLVHAAGNDAKNTTEIVDDNFPTPTLIGNSGRFESWVEVGASSSKKDANLPAVFSNFGKTSVDVFAPGVRIESTIPGNQYAIFSGTSMASPAFAGAAALIWSMKPDLTAVEVKDILFERGRTYDSLLVNLPSNQGPLGQVLFSELSITGKIADAFQSMKALLEL